MAGVTQRVFTNAAPTLLDILQFGRGHGGADFLVFADRRWTFDQFFADVDALAATLQHDMGVQPGDRIAIAMRNCSDWIITFAASVHVGAVAVLINSWGSAEELQFTLRDSDPAILAADLPRTRLGVDVLSERGIPVLFSDVDGDETGLESVPHLDVRTIRDAVAAGRGRDYVKAPQATHDTALLLYTSGSTGHPKGVLYRHIAVGQSLMHMMLVGFLGVEFGGPVELRAEASVEAHLVTVPLFHATGLFGGFLLPCAVGHKIVLLRKWDAETAMQVIEAEKITMMSTVPAILKDLLTHPRLADHDVSSIARVAAAGAATPADLPDLISDKLGIANRSSGYGMTETTSVCATMSGPVFDLKPTAAGIVSPIIDLRVVDVEEEVLPPGHEGEIQLRGVIVTPGYWHRDDLTHDAFTSDGWLRTGDLGRIDDDGFLHITGRIKEIVIRGGENIAPVEIENVAYRHTGVKEVAVFGVPDDAMGEELAMVCHPQPGFAPTEDELRRHMRNALPGFKVPKYIRLTDTPLPRNASEKIHRLAIRNNFTVDPIPSDSPASATRRPESVRRVVTGHDTQGKAVFVEDRLVEPISVAMTSTVYHQLWRADAPSTFPDSGAIGPSTTFFPQLGGYRFFLLTLPPGEGHGNLDGVDIDAGLRELQDKLPGVLETNDFDSPGMHTTETVDMEIVLSGEIVLELDDGIETTLRAGDVNIQNGTRHRWHNRGTQPAVVAVAMVGASRAKPS
ncbi:AMP-binding protein [Nocardia sp. NBC_00565]|uniref:AMP-binding protein n=1 Tax=Nocardia sp. NBC_00565 TaxID=2975993 RepID=UPI002E805ED9|nr:AMP-binding protein [Nocardia sp. NBC_00565]WUC04703.1 AMP-binding protein [Nocardia sp. NBC_00565]